MQKAVSLDSLFFNPEIEKTAKALRKARRDELREMTEKMMQIVHLLRYQLEIIDTVMITDHRYLENDAMPTISSKSLR